MGDNIWGGLFDWGQASSSDVRLPAYLRLALTWRHRCEGNSAKDAMKGAKQ